MIVLDNKKVVSLTRSRQLNRAIGLAYHFFAVSGAISLFVAPNGTELTMTELIFVVHLIQTLFDT